MADWASQKADSMNLQMTATWNTAVIAEALRKARNDAIDEATEAVADAFWSNEARTETIKRIQSLKTS